MTDELSITESRKVLEAFQSFRDPPRLVINNNLGMPIQVTTQETMDGDMLHTVTITLNKQEKQNG